MNRSSTRLTPREIDRMMRQTAKQLFGKPLDYGSCRPVFLRYLPPFDQLFQRRSKP